MMKINAHLGAVLLACVVGCSSSASPSSTNEASTCVQGWYLNPPAFASCACATGSAGPECQFGDCSRWTFIGFQSNMYYSGELSYSLQGDIMTGNLSAVAFQMTSNGYQIPKTGFVGNIDSCSSTQMQVNGINHVRPPTTVSNSLSAVVTAGQTSWSGLQMQ